MNDQDNTFNERELFGQTGVEDNGKDYNGNNEQRPVPRLRDVIGIVQSDQAFDDGSSEEREPDHGALPAYCQEPAYDDNNMRHVYVNT